jgi:YidC/Oxa1 family membrane protein insertase
VLDPLYRLIASAMNGIHTGIGPIFGEKTFASWVLSIMLLVIGVRLLLVPAMLKAAKSQRQMAAMQPKIAELRKKYGNDKQRLNEEMMKLQQEHGNPLLGCLPMLIQIPLFISVYGVMRSVVPSYYSATATIPSTARGVDAAGHLTNVCNPGNYCFVPKHGLSAQTIHDIANAKAFNVSVSAAFSSPHSLLTFLHSHGGAVKAMAVVIILLASATTFLSMRQSNKRTPMSADPTQAQVQKLMIYLAPAGILLIGFKLPVGSLFYFLTTNVFTMVQQHFMFKKMGPMPVAATPGTTPTGPPPKRQAAVVNPSASNGSTATAKPGRKSKSVGDVPLSFGNVVGPPQPVYRQRTTQKKRKKR